MLVNKVLSQKDGDYGDFYMMKGFCSASYMAMTLPWVYPVCCFSCHFREPFCLLTGTDGIKDLGEPHHYHRSMWRFTDYTR